MSENFYQLAKNRKKCNLLEDGLYLLMIRVRDLAQCLSCNMYEMYIIG